MSTKSSSEPSPRQCFFSASTHSSVYLWGGQTHDSKTKKIKPVEDLDTLHCFKVTSDSWSRLKLKSLHPPGVYRGACAMIGEGIYMYGGYNKEVNLTGSLYKLNLETLTWLELFSSGPNTPQKKRDCFMIPFNETLVMYGGYTEKGLTNELHIFDIINETWSSPQITGDIPKPDDYFVLNKVSKNKIIRCGGVNDPAIYVLDLSTIHWTRQRQSGPFLTGHSAATCVGYDSDHAQLLMIGELGVWLLNVATLKLKKLEDIDLLPGYKDLKRKGHCATMLSSTATSVEIFIFGGETSDDDGHCNISSLSSTVLILKKKEEDEWWRVTDIIKKNESEESSISYSNPTYEEKESPANIQHVGNIKPTTDKDAIDESQFGNDSSTQEGTGLVCTPWQTSQTSPLQASQTSSQVDSSKHLVHEDKEVIKCSKDILTPEEVHFSRDVVKAIFKKQRIRRKVANLLLKGLPGSGKTSLLDRLLNNPFRDNCSSTGLCERGVTVEIGPSSTHNSVYASEDNTWKETDFNKSIISQLNTCKVFTSYNITKTPQQQFKHHEPETPKLDFQGCCIEQHVKEVLSKQNIYNIVDLQTKNILYIRDTGGQVEFQESLSLLIFSPSIFIFVLRTDIDIYTKNSIHYRIPNGEIINQYKSSISTMDALIQFLTSVSAIQTTEEEIFQVDGTSVCHKPIVFIIGTHIDKLGSKAPSKLSSINTTLHEMIKKRKFSHLIRYADGRSCKVMYEVDNTCNEGQYFQVLRSDINQYIRSRKEFSVEYPVSYLLFCLELQSIQETVISIENCKKLAAKFYIEEEEIRSLLQFLHFRIGIIQHFDVEGISDIVIKEPQVLFNKITELIINTFLKAPLSLSEQEYFCQKGILEHSTFEAVITDEDQISSEQFLMFLLHLRVAVPFTDREGVKKYFIPSVLNHVQKSTSDTINTNISPLAITFKLGHCPNGLFGMLISYLLDPEENRELTFDLLEDHIYQDQVLLQVNSLEETDQIWLSSHPSHLKVYIAIDNYEVSSASTASHALRETTSNEVCSKVRLTLDKCIQLSLKKLHYNSVKIGPCFSLTCPEEKCFQLHEVKKGKKSWFMRCSVHNRKLLLPESGLCWYGEENTSSLAKICSETTSTTASSREDNKLLSSPQLHAADFNAQEEKQSSVARVSSCEESYKKSASGDIYQVPEFALKSLILLKWSDKDGQSHHLRLRNEMSSNWRDIGVLLGLSPSRIDGIKSYHNDKASPCCDDILQDWLKNSSCDYPASWEGLLALLEDVEQYSLKVSLEGALENINRS